MSTGLQSAASGEPTNPLAVYVKNVLNGSSIPRSWDGEDSPEYILKHYLLTLERRVVQLGGSLERWADESKSLQRPPCVMSAELLRRAATKLREHATAASRGPWEMDGADGLVWPGCMGDPVSGSELLADGAFIALMHPPVALALAEWLEAQATDVENAVAAWSRDTSYIDKHPGGVQAHTENMFQPSIAAARAILREPEVTS